MVKALVFIAFWVNACCYPALVGATVEDQGTGLSADALQYLESLVQQTEADSRASIRVVLLETALPDSLDERVDALPQPASGHPPDVTIAVARKDRVVRVSPAVHLRARLPAFVTREIQTEMMQLLAPEDGLKAFDLGLPMLARALKGDLKEYDAPAEAQSPKEGSAQRALPARAHLVDEIGGLTPQAARSISERIALMEGKGGLLMGVVLLPDTGVESLREFGERLQRQWGLSNAPARRALLLVVSAKDRQAIALTDYGLEGQIDERRATEVARAIRGHGSRSFPDSPADWEARVGDMLQRASIALGLEQPSLVEVDAAPSLRTMAWVGALLIVAGGVLQWWLSPWWVALGAMAIAAGVAWLLGLAPGTMAVVAGGVLLLTRFLPAALLDAIGRKD